MNPTSNADLVQAIDGIQRAIRDTNPNLLDYSLTEQDTGLRWIDGKSIYQKTLVYTGNTTTPTSYDIPTGITDTIGTLIQASGHMTWAGQPWLTPFPGPYASDQFYGGYLHKVDKVFKWSRVGNAGQTPTLNVTLLYTKA